MHDQVKMFIDMEMSSLCVGVIVAAPGGKLARPLSSVAAVRPKVALTPSSQHVAAEAGGVQL